MSKSQRLIKNAALVSMALLGSGLVATIYMQNKKYTQYSQYSHSEESMKEALSNSEWRSYALGQVVPLNSDSKLFRFVLARNGEALKLNFNSIASIKLQQPSSDNASDHSCVELYPINSENNVGFMDVVIHKKEQPELFKSKAGSLFNFKGPFQSNFNVDEYLSSTQASDMISIIAQDVEHGVAPSLQLVYKLLIQDNSSSGNRKVNSSSPNKPKIHLFYVVSNQKDYLLKQSLQDLKGSLSGRIEMTTIQGGSTLTLPSTELLEALHVVKSNASHGPVIVCGSQDFEESLSSQLLEQYQVKSISLHDGEKRS
ncbi:hypothetical protein C9374_011749 [Naegleria lovaniensis]|uniref:Uncharacterized protein n=1 Tax=Naegleria lovaniensis TaxID=51637 RepID=A0AA88KEP4_NAELO|nr:uncharacterized protein C9374_011749 [Naegleria lovaniensis]KAG2373864.1 hypothetical protein C9374_011749 [Naegleria lovaniensis]